MSTLEYTVSLLETIPRKKSKRFKTISIYYFRDDVTMPFKPLREERDC